MLQLVRLLPFFASFAIVVPVVGCVPLPISGPVGPPRLIHLERNEPQNKLSNEGLITIDLSAARIDLKT